MKKKWKLTAVLAVILLAGLYYYIALPVVNIHSTETWFMIILLLVKIGRASCRERVSTPV